MYQTVKRGDPKLDVTFDLTTMLEHVTLVITDKSAGEYYVVNNDQVSAPHRGDPLTQVAPQYGAVRGLPYAVGPAVTSLDRRRIRRGNSTTRRGFVTLPRWTGG